MDGNRVTVNEVVQLLKGYNSVSIPHVETDLFVVEVYLFDDSRLAIHNVEIVFVSSTYDTVTFEEVGYAYW